MFFDSFRWWRRRKVLFRRHPQFNSPSKFNPFLPCLHGKCQKKKFPVWAWEMLIHSCSLTILTGILLPSSISFDPDLPLFYLFNLRAVEPWAVLDRDISASPLHVCVQCFLLFFSIFLPAWQVGSGPFTKNVIALNASWDNLDSTETSTLWELKNEIVQKNKTHKDKCSLWLCNFCFFLIFFYLFSPAKIEWNHVVGCLAQSV